MYECRPNMRDSIRKKSNPKLRLSLSPKLSIKLTMRRGTRVKSGVVYLVVARRLQFAQLQPVQRRQPRCANLCEKLGLARIFYTN